jgi:predicted MFS family arabinose efflux permease
MGAMTEQRTIRRGAAVGFAFVAYAFGVTMVGTTLPTPLYAIYQHEYGFGSLLTTVIYAVYAAGVIAALLLFGRASDAYGRRRVLLVGLAASAASALVFLSDAGLAALFVGRVLSGLSAGIFTTTATVTLVDLAPAARQRTAALVATTVNMLGLGCGPLLAGVLAQWAPLPLRLPFLANLVLLVPAAIGVLRAPEPVAVRPGARLSVQRPSVATPARAVFVPASVAVFAAFAVFGLLTSIEPGFLATVLGLDSRALAGLVVFTMFAGSALGQVGLARVPSRVALPVGCLVLVAGLGGIAGGLLGRSVAALIAGTVVIGVGQALSFRSGMAAITAASPEAERAATVSSFFVVAYVGISLPVVAVGVAANLWGLRTAGIAFTAAVALVALGALVAVLRLDRRRPQPA